MIRCHGDRDILFARRLAYASDCAVVSIDYHLAPQYFYPYQIDETEILINHLLQNAAQYHLRQNYILSGQSSGGNIACAVTLRSIQKRQLQKPALLLLAYSWLDLHTDPNDKPDDCPDERKEQYRFYKDCYLCDVDDNIAEVSPALSPSSVFREFPETLMIEGGLDELREENLRLFMTLCDAGTTVQMQFFPESMHGFMVNQKADWKKAQKIIQQKVSEVFSEKCRQLRSKIRRRIIR